MFFNGNKKEIELKFTPVFIGGPGRSGTSVLHATLCSDFKSGNTNEYIGESSYFLKFIEIFLVEMRNFKMITYSYFNEMESEYFLYHSNLLRTLLVDIWIHLGKPKNLILKAPAFIQHFPLLGQFLPTAKFIGTVRNPLDIAASMKNVVAKYQQDQVFDEEYIKGFCSRLNYAYKLLSEQKKFIEDRFYLSRYESFINGDLDSELEKFLDMKIVEEDIWKSSKFRLETGWLTDKYKAPRQDTSIGNYKTALTEAEIAQVSTQCAELIKHFNY